MFHDILNRPPVNSQDALQCMKPDRLPVSFCQCCEITLLIGIQSQQINLLKLNGLLEMLHGHLVVTLAPCIAVARFEQADGQPGRTT